MLKRVIPAIFAASALVAGLWASNADARLASNGLRLSNGIRVANGIRMPNGDGLLLPSQSVETTALQPVRLTMPDGTELNFR